jgi:hypothetical protein
MYEKVLVQNFHQELNYYSPKRVKLNIVQTQQISPFKGFLGCGRKGLQEEKGTNGFQVKNILSWSGCFMPVIPELRRLRQEYFEFKASMGYISRLSQKKETNLHL